MLYGWNLYHNDDGDEFAIFDFGQTVTISAFSIQSRGDFTHDTNEFYLSVGLNDKISIYALGTSRE